MSEASGHAGGTWRGLAGAVLGAVGAGVIAALSGRVDQLGTVLLAAIGSLLGWGLEGLFERSRRRAAAVVVLVSVIAAGVVVYVSAVDFPGRGGGSTEAESSGGGRPSSSVVTTGETSSSSAPPASAAVDAGEVNGDVPPPAGPVAFEWLTDAVRISHAVPRILAFPRGQVGNGQLVDFSFDNLSVGAIEFDMFDPGGSTFTGWSRANPANSLSVSYIFNPFVTGEYRMRIRDKETGAAAETTVYLEAGSAGPPVVEATGASSGTADVTVTGKGCDTDGASVVVEYTGAGNSDSYSLTMPDGQRIDGGVTADSVGHAFGGVVLRSNRCTGTPVDGFEVVLHAPDGSVRARATFAVPN